MSLKLGMQHRGLKLYRVYINDGPGLTLAYITARSNLVVYMFEWGKLLQSIYMGETFSKGLNWHYKCVNGKNDPLELSAPDHLLQASIHLYDYNFKRSVFLKSLGQ